MKQQITKEQWNELNEEQRNYFTVATHIVRPTIGQMIEFIDDEEDDASPYPNWTLPLENAKGYVSVEAEDLCDELWGITKKKIDDRTKETTRSPQD